MSRGRNIRSASCITGSSAHDAPANAEHTIAHSSSCFILPPVYESGNPRNGETHCNPEGFAEPALAAQRQLNEGFATSFRRSVPQRQASAVGFGDLTAQS